MSDSAVRQFQDLRVTRDHPQLVREGQVIEVAEADYMYGGGGLKLRVIQVSPEAHHPGIEWVTLIGVEILWNGEDGMHRNVIVRADALRRQRQSPLDSGTHSHEASTEEEGNDAAEAVSTA